ncbi:hypothetical protein NP493_317g00018 [Ridgeia piscesae]|uniref:Uncharacterized protein n=1 Tax=Ridgeia piscesae TaxID=27915 RepID=A0AAD9L6B7_RIDPI|nr:hypothetical protein NP493_317g00018 [Ridgeia piscesae]
MKDMSAKVDSVARHFIALEKQVEELKKLTANLTRDLNTAAATINTAVARGAAGGCHTTCTSLNTTDLVTALNMTKMPNLKAQVGTMADCLNSSLVADLNQVKATMVNDSVDIKQTVSHITNLYYDNKV